MKKIIEKIKSIAQDKRSTIIFDSMRTRNILVQALLEDGWCGDGDPRFFTLNPRYNKALWINTRPQYNDLYAGAYIFINVPNRENIHLYSKDADIIYMKTSVKEIPI